MDEQNLENKANNSPFLSFVMKRILARLVVNHGGRIVAFTLLLLGFVVWDRTLRKDTDPLVVAQTGAMEVISITPTTKNHEPDKPFLKLLNWHIGWALDTYVDVLMDAFNHDASNPFLSANQSKLSENQDGENRDSKEEQDKKKLSPLESPNLSRRTDQFRPEFRPVPRDIDTLPPALSNRPSLGRGLAAPSKKNETLVGERPAVDSTINWNDPFLQPILRGEREKLALPKATPKPLPLATPGPKSIPK